MQYASSHYFSNLNMALNCPCWKTYKSTLCQVCTYCLVKKDILKKYLGLLFCYPP